MANIKASKKAIKVIAKKTEANHKYKSRVQNLIKNLEKAILAKDSETASTLLKDLQKHIDKAAAKGVTSKNTAARQKSRLTNKVKNMK